MNIQNLQQKNDALLTVKQKVLIQKMTQKFFLTKSIESRVCDYLIWLQKMLLLQELLLLQAIILFE